VKALREPSFVRRALVVAVPTALLGLALALMGAGIAGFYVAGALSSPAIAWILAGQTATRRPRR
jgi:hypothetical protein